MRPVVAKVLRDAALVVERAGWTQGGYCRDGKVCILGALRWACGARPGELPPRELTHISPPDDHTPMGEVYDFAKRAAGSIAYGVSGNLDGWNDRPGRTADEVIQVLRAAADEAERGFYDLG